MASINQQQDAESYEPLPLEQRKREETTPAGLQNIGNTCYFNSILQVYYHIPAFVQTILEFQDDGKALEMYLGSKGDKKDDP